MNMKPTLKQVQEWRAMAYRYADKQNGNYNEADELAQEKFAELAAAWGAEQAQQTTVEPELPVAVAHISDPDAFDAYEVIPVYTAAQMHEHYQAGARAGAAGSQDARRYRAIRDGLEVEPDNSGIVVSLIDDFGGETLRGEQADSAIDAAMQGEQQP